MTAIRPGTLTALALATLTLCAPPAGVAAVPITHCGQVVKGTAELTGDLSCAGPGYPVTLGPGATLRLNGFTLTSDSSAVLCPARCRIFGPGALVRDGAPAGSGGTCRGDSGVVANHAVLADVALRNFSTGVTAFTSLRANRISVTEGCFGLAVGRSARIVDSTVVDNVGFGVRSIDKIFLLRSTVSGHPRDLIAPTRPKLRDSTCETSATDDSPLYVDFWGVCGG